MDSNLHNFKTTCVCNLKPVNNAQRKIKNFRRSFVNSQPIHTSLSFTIKLNKVKRTSRYKLRSDGGLLLEDYSARSKKTLGDRVFETAAPKIWNILLEDIIMQDNYNIFKGKLKTHYFRLAYNF